MESDESEVRERRNRMPETGESDPLIGGAGQDESEADELKGCGASLACDPRRPLHKYLVLIIMCFLSFGKSDVILSPTFYYSWFPTVIL